MLKGDLVMAYTVRSEKPTNGLLTTQGQMPGLLLVRGLSNSAVSPNLAPTAWRIPGEQTMFTPR